MQYYLLYAVVRHTYFAKNIVLPDYEEINIFSICKPLYLYYPVVREGNLLLLPEKYNSGGRINNMVIQARHHSLTWARAPRNCQLLFDSKTIYNQDEGI